MADLDKIYAQISCKKKHQKLHTKGCTAEQIFYQIQDATNEVIAQAEQFLAKPFCPESVHTDEEQEQDEVCKDEEPAQKDEADSDIANSKDFFEKMDEAGDESDENSVGSDYLDELELCR